VDDGKNFKEIASKFLKGLEPKVVLGKDDSTPEELIRVADKRMYKQKAEKKLKSRVVS